MRVENEVSAFVETQGHAVGFEVGNGAGFPEEKMAVGVENLRLDANLHAAETGARFGFALARGCSAIDEDVGVMHVTFVAGANFHRVHPTRLARSEAGK